MNIERTRDNMLKVLEVMLNEEMDQQVRLDAYEFLMEDCEDIVEDMIQKAPSLEGDTQNMLLEVLANYPGHKEVFMDLVSHLYQGDDVALFASLIGKYEDEQGILVLKTFCEEYEPNYYEYQEIVAAIERLGGDFSLKQDFSDDPLYRYLKGLDEEDQEDSRKSPFEEKKNLLEDDDEEDQ